jgi:chromosome partitioning protein
MPVISLVSSKGGVGKSTAAVVLAGEIIDAKGTVSVIDADPNQPILRWSNDLGKRKGLRVIGDVSERNMIDTIEAEAKRSAFVIIDLEGSANLMVAYAISRSDLALVPVQGSHLDAEEGARSIALIRETEKGFKTKVDHAVLLSRTSTAIRERTMNDILASFEKGGVDVLKTQMIDRAAFRAIFSFGCSLHDLKSSDVSGLEKAKDNADALIQEVISRISPKSVKRRDRAVAA